MFHKIIDPSADGWRGSPTEFPSSSMKKNNHAWVHDSDAVCSVCNKPAEWRHRHHCRCCGALTCDPCSKEHCAIEEGKARKRFCTPCQTRFPRCDPCKGKGKVGSWFCPSDCDDCEGTGRHNGGRRRESARRRRLFAPRYRDSPVLRRLSNEISKESNTNTQSK